MALGLQALMGVVPLTTTIAIPMEEYRYEYNFDIDPSLFRIDVQNNTLKIGVLRSGSIQFAYGGSPVSCLFPEGGVYEIAFSEDWNNVTGLERIGNLPSDRAFFWWPSFQSEHDVAVTTVVPSENIVQQGALLPVNVTVRDQGEFPENLTLTLNCNETAIDQLAGIEIQSHESVNVTMYWNTSGFGKGEYRIAAGAGVVPNEISTEDNTLQASTAVTVVIDGHDIAVKSAALLSYSRIGVVFKNYGSYAEVFNITISANSVPIYSCESALEAGIEARFEFYWNTSGWQRGDYIIAAYVDPLPEEMNIGDNLQTAGTLVLYVGDVDGNGCVNIIDLYVVCLHFATELGEPGYDVFCDVNSDQRINMVDLYIVALHYGSP